MAVMLQFATMAAYRFRPTRMVLEVWPPSRRLKTARRPTIPRVNGCHFKIPEHFSGAFPDWRNRTDQQQTTRASENSQPEKSNTRIFRLLSKNSMCSTSHMITSGSTWVNTPKVLILALVKTCFRGRNKSKFFIIESKAAAAGSTHVQLLQTLQTVLCCCTTSFHKWYL